MPPAGVKKGTKRARQYEHIKDSAQERGTPTDRAEEIAARTVNRRAAARYENHTPMVAAAIPERPAVAWKSRP